MPECCMAEKYGGWCAGFETIIWPDGKHYCEFHKPKNDYSYGRIIAFTETVYKHIDGAREIGDACDLRGTIFPGDISFWIYDEENPLPPINFGGAFFQGEVHFKKVHFGGEAGFEETTFIKQAAFSDSHFEGRANFKRTIFESRATFVNAKFHNAVDFNDTQFKSQMFLAGAVISKKGDFTGSIFKGDSYFSFSNMTRVSFSGCYFENPAFFRNTTFKRSGFYGCFVSDHIEFYQADLRSVCLTGAPVEKFKFINCEWPHIGPNKIIFDAQNVFDFSPRASGDAERIERLKEERRILGVLADQFRRLKKVAVAERDHALAGDWHFMEKEMQRRKYGNDVVFHFKENRYGQGLLNIAKWLVLVAYRILCGYGERPLRGLVCLLILAGLPCMLNFLFQYDLFPGKNLNYLPFVNAEYAASAPDWEKVFSGAWRYIVLPIQAGLFGLAVRNRMRR